MESLTTKPSGALGPKYDKASADDALAEFFKARWIDKDHVSEVERRIDELYQALGKEERHPFDEMLVFWLDFSSEDKPRMESDEEVYAWLERAVVKACGVTEIDGLTSEHLARFEKNYQDWVKLDQPFAGTSGELARAAKLASAPLPNGRGLQEIARAQKEVLKELNQCDKLILDPDAVHVRLAPRVERLEEPYVETYLNELTLLESLQGQLRTQTAAVAKSAEFDVLTDFSSEVVEAQRALEGGQRQLNEMPSSLRKYPEDRDRSEKDVRCEANVRDLESQDLTLVRLRQACEVRQNALLSVSSPCLKSKNIWR